MTFSLRRSQRAFVRCASITLALLTIVALLAPRAVFSAQAPKIVSVDVTGNVHIPSAQILAILEAKVGLPYDPKLVSDDIARLNALGYFADVATPEVRQRPNGIAITYRVVENPVITKILFSGNINVPSDTLLALMDTSVGQVFNSNTFKQDVLKINNYYQQIGFGGLPTNVIDLNLDSNTGVLSLTIREGFTIRKVNITGDTLLPPNIILAAIHVKPGIVYSDALRDKDADALKTLYDKFDMLMPSFTGGIDPTSIDLKNGTADVTYNINVDRVALVQITGNTKTKDAVIRRELRLRPGMVITNAAIKRDYERLNATGYFSKVDVNPKPGPDPKHPELIVLDWNVTEQKTAQAQVGFGYSGGITGEGLYGTLGYSDNNLHGTGNGVGIQVQQGARDAQSQIQLTIPYLGNTPKSEKYGFSGTIFNTKTTYYYPVYSVATNGSTIAPISGGSPPPIPVTLYSNGNAQEIGSIVSTSSASSTGVNAQISRRLSDYTEVQFGGSISSITDDTTVPAPYYFQGGQPNVLVGPTPNPLGTTATDENGSFGITATSIANVNTGVPYRLTDFTIGAVSDTRDDPYNPTRGTHVSISELFSDPALGSSFQFTQTALDISKFFPFRTGGTFAIHGLAEGTTGAIPPNQLYTFSDQQVRGYDSVFYGTDAFLGQAEFRQPVTPDRKLYVALFVDQLAYKVGGAAPLLNPYTNRIVGYPANWSELFDYGFGIRFDVPQLNLHTVRIDFAKGANGTHTSFGIGQSF